MDYHLIGSLLYKNCHEIADFILYMLEFDLKVHSHWVVCYRVSKRKTKYSAIPGIKKTYEVIILYRY